MYSRDAGLGLALLATLSHLMALGVVLRPTEVEATASRPAEGMGSQEGMGSHMAEGTAEVTVEGMAEGMAALPRRPAWATATSSRGRSARTMAAASCSEGQLSGMFAA